MKHYCQCGCGQETKVITKTQRSQGWIKGEYPRFIKGHNINIHGRQANRKHSFGVTYDGRGYRRIRAVGHPRATNGRGHYVDEHILVAEKIYGGPLPNGAIVHHKDGNNKNNDPSNLQICESRAAHLALHRKMRATAPPIQHRMKGS